MKRVYSIILTLLIFSCHEQNPRDAASLVSGIYPVTTYIVDGDTLVSPSGLNRTPYLNFRTEVSRLEDNKLQVIYKYNTKEGVYCGSGSSNIRLQESEGKYILRNPDNTIDTYNGYADGKIFYTDGAGWDPKTGKRYRTVIVGVR
jgi:hypothetical protein